MARREPFTNEQRRLLKIAGRMPLTSVANLAPVLGLDEEKVRRMLGALRRGSWITSVVRGMTERRQHRWFLTRRAVDLFYVTDHQHPAPREEARAVGLAEFHPEGDLPGDFRERFALDHDHSAHLEGQVGTPFAATGPVVENGHGDGQTTSTRPGPPRHGGLRPRSGGWACWSRSTAWPRTCSAAAGSTGPPAIRHLPTPSSKVSILLSPTIGSVDTT